jgi:arylsulfatase A-like enzyme
MPQPQLSRRELLRALGAASALAAFPMAAYCREGQKKPAKRMNVLFLVVDDLNTWLLSDPNRYTGKVAAPAIQKLASEGVLFRRAYCGAPKCSPSRTAVLSGVAPWVSGIYQNAQVTGDSPALQRAVSLPKHFKDNGYYVATAGKVSHGYDVKVEWDNAAGYNIRDPYPPNAPLSPIGRGEKDWGPIHLNESEMNDTKCADFTIAELQKPHEKPFFIACGLFHPHYPWYVPQRYLDMYPLDSIVLPERRDDDLADVPEEGVELARARTHQKIVAAGQYRNAVQGYLASTTFADTQMGRILAALEASPYRDNTLVVLWSDHGFHLGEKSHWAKGTLWEEGTHALLMFKVPGMTKPKRVCRRFVSFLDIYPTLVELCGLPRPSHLNGNSLVPLLRDPGRPWDKPVITGYLGMGDADVLLTVRTEEFRYIRYGEGSEEFYHCAKDPHEWINQINNPEYREEIKRHRAMMPDPAKPVRFRERGKKASGRKRAREEKP